MASFACISFLIFFCVPAAVAQGLRRCADDDEPKDAGSQPLF